MGMTPATRVQICGAYHGPDSSSETTHTRHHRGTPGGDIDSFSATQGLVGHANRVQPYPQTATGYSRDSILLGGESSLSVPLWARRRGPSPPRASVIDGRDLATVSTACRA